jgi:predicted N-acetyltransferase YhbS
MTSTPAPPVSIRGWQHKDIPQLAVLSGELGYPSTEAQVADRLAQMGRDNKLLVAVDRESDSAIGWIELSAVTHLTSDRILEISGLVVSGGARSAGIGSLLVGAAEKMAAQMGMERVRVRSNIVRDRAHEFYERLGFENVKTSKVFEKAVKAHRA